jgi:hypothetical protein
MARENFVKIKRVKLTHNIRLLLPKAEEAIHAKIGDIYDLPIEDADHLIGLGKAEETKEEPKKEKAK